MSNLKIDEDFPERVIRTSLILTGFIFFISLAKWSFEITAGFGIGAVISLLFFIILRYSVKCFLNPDEKGGKIFFGIAFLLKFTALILSLFLIIKYLSINFLALMVGIGLVQVVLLLKVIGIVIVNYMNQNAAQSDVNCSKSTK